MYLNSLKIRLPVDFCRADFIAFLLKSTSGGSNGGNSLNNLLQKFDKLTIDCNIKNIIQNYINKQLK